MARSIGFARFAPAGLRSGRRRKPGRLDNLRFGLHNARMDQRPVLANHADTVSIARVVPKPGWIFARGVVLTLDTQDVITKRTIDAAPRLANDWKLEWEDQPEPIASGLLAFLTRSEERRVGKECRSR